MQSWKKTFYIMWVAQFCSMMGFSFVFPFMPFYLRDYLGVTGEANVAWWAGMASSATGFSLMVFSPMWGHLADRYGRKLMVLRSMFGGGVVIGLMAFARTAPDLVVLRAIQGAFTGTLTASVAMVASVVPAGRAGFALGMMQAAAFAGTSVGPLFGGLLWEWWGPRPTFLLAGAVLALAGLVVKFGVVEHFVRHPEHEKEKRGSFGQVFAASGFLVAAFVIFQIQFANMVRQPVFVLFIEKLHGTTEGAASLVGKLAAAAGVVGAVFAVVFGRCSDAWGHKRTLVLCTTLAGIAVIPQAFSQKVWQMFALQLVFGLGVAGMMPSVNAIVKNIMLPQNLGKAFGATSSVRCLGMALGPLVGGYLAAHLGPHIRLRAPFLLTGVLLLATALLVLWQIGSKAGEPAPASSRLEPTLDPGDGAASSDELNQLEAE